MSKTEIDRWVKWGASGDITCPTCLKQHHLYFNGGEMDQVKCCGFTWQQEYPVEPDVVVYKDDAMKVLATDITGTMLPGLHTLRTHKRSDCVGQEACCVHKPSKHHMRKWQMLWRADRQLMERVCEHGIGHPDPDHIAYVEAVRGPVIASAERVHGCDGCCTPPEAPKIIDLMQALKRSLAQKG